MNRQRLERDATRAENTAVDPVSESLLKRDLFSHLCFSSSDQTFDFAWNPALAINSWRFIVSSISFCECHRNREEWERVGTSFPQGRLTFNQLPKHFLAKGALLQDRLKEALTSRWEHGKVEISHRDISLLPKPEVLPQKAVKRAQEKRSWLEDQWI